MVTSGGRAAVLLYHRVAPVVNDPWQLAVEPGRFAEHLEVITSRFRPLGLPELIRTAREGEIPPRAVSVTFDDGYRDNLEVAKPLLERHGVPATVFVITGYLDSDRSFWWDELQSLCRDSEYRELHGALQPLAHDERQVRLDELAATVDGGEGVKPQALTTAELAVLAESDLIEVGAHTVTHPLLSRLTRRERLDELRFSKRHLEQVLGGRVGGASYPYGDVTPDTVDSARVAGFSHACTSVADVVTIDSDVLELPRLHVQNVPGDELERWLEDWLEPR